MFWNLSIEWLGQYINLMNLKHEMFWNLTAFADLEDQVKMNLKHEMFWNSYLQKYDGYRGEMNLKHEMFWNFKASSWGIIFFIWTLNMKCFEITPLLFLFKFVISWTLNMKCFEIWNLLEYPYSYSMNLKHEMFWNESSIFSSNNSFIMNLKHEMFWNYNPKHFRIHI